MQFDIEPIWNQIPHFSNPQVDYTLSTGNEAPTGTASRNNALYISNWACIAADLESAGGFSTIIRENWGSSIPFCYSSIPFCAENNPGNNGGPNNGPYTYEWRYSLSPNSSTQLFSTSECPNFVQPFPFHQTYYVTLTVTDANTGESTSNSRVVKFAACNQQLQAPRQSAQQLSRDITNGRISVLINNQPQLVHTHLEASQVQLFNTSGQLLSSLTTQGNVVEFTDSYPSGLYYIRVVNHTGNSETHPVWNIR